MRCYTSCTRIDLISILVFVTWIEKEIYCCNSLIFECANCWSDSCTIPAKQIIGAAVCLILFNHYPKWIGGFSDYNNPIEKRQEDCFWNNPINTNHSIKNHWKKLRLHSNRIGHQRDYHIDTSQQHATLSPMLYDVKVYPRKNNTIFLCLILHAAPVCPTLAALLRVQIL